MLCLCQFREGEKGGVRALIACLENRMEGDMEETGGSHAGKSIETVFLLHKWWDSYTNVTVDS